MAPKGSLDVIIAGPPPSKGGDGSEGEGDSESTASDGEVAAMEEFESAKTTSAKADALSAFIRICMDKYGSMGADNKADHKGE